MTPSEPASKNKLLSIGNAAALLIVTALAGQVLGFLRTKLVNANFPVVGPHSTDAYFAAFMIPDFFFFTLAAGALGVTMIPLLSDRLHKGDRKAAWELAASVMNFLTIIMTVVAVIMLIFARPLIQYIVAPGLSEPQLETATTIMRFLAFNPLLFTVSGILNSVQQTMGRFFFYAIAPLFYNFTIIASIFIFKNNIGLVGLGVGALIGAVIQLIIAAFGTINTGFHWHSRILWRSSDFRTILGNLPARSLDQGIDQVEAIVETRIASGLGTGNITYYSNAYILSTAPILLLGTAISTAAFPRLNQRLSQGRPDLFRRDFLMVLRAMIWISAPSLVIAFLGRGYLARMIYSQGNQKIAGIFGLLTIAIFFRILYSIISRWFYAHKDTHTPLLVSVFIVALNIILAYSLARPSVYGVYGLAVAQSIVALVEVLILSIIMLYRDPKLFDAYFWGGVIRIMSVTGFSMMACYAMVKVYPLQLADKGILTLGTKLLFIAGVTFAVHIAISSLFGLEEVRPFFRRLRSLALKPIKLDM